MPAREATGEPLILLLKDSCLSQTASISGLANKTSYIPSLFSTTSSVSILSSHAADRHRFVKTYAEHLHSKEIIQAERLHGGGTEILAGLYTQGLGLGTESN